MPDAEIAPVARALGRIPSGLFIVTTRSEAGPLGMLGSFVMQVGFEPPTVCVSIAAGRDHLGAIRSSGRFALSVVDDASSGVMAPFFRKLPAGQMPFADLATRATPAGSLVLSDCLAWLDCRVFARLEGGDRIYYWADVIAGKTVGQGRPLTESQLLSAATDEQKKHLLADRETDVQFHRPLARRWREELPPGLRLE